MTPQARILVALAVVAALILGPSWPSAAGTGSDEAAFVARINDLRAARGLNRLRVDSELTSQARRWASVMARDDQLKHAGDLSAGVSADWDLLGENVGTDTVPDVDEVFTAFVHSPPHLANLLDPRFEYVGVGVVYGANGELWTTHRFMSVRSAPTPPASTTEPTVAPAAQPGEAASGASSRPAPAPRPAPTTTTTAPTTTITEAPVLATRPLSDGSPDPGLDASPDADPASDPAGDTAGAAGAAEAASSFAGLSADGALGAADLLRVGPMPLVSITGGGLLSDAEVAQPQAGSDPSLPPAAAPARPASDLRLVAQVLAELTNLDG